MSLMLIAALSLITVPVVVVGYAYGLYPLLLWLLGRQATLPTIPGDAEEWPFISVTVPAFNEEATIGGKITRLLELDYPPERRQIVVVSDASTDRTDEIVRSFADRGVELVRLPCRGGKTAAENAARAHLHGSIVVNTDASVRLHPWSLKHLVAALGDPTVGVASGCDLSVARQADDTNVGESGYVGYEMWVRDLETTAGGIVGASGCFYASRMELHMEIVPEALSRDFAAPLIAREHGFRSVSVRGAVCFVPRSSSLRREYRRKVRTMTRGLQTLYYKRHLMNPRHYGRFAWMLISHKLIRWLVPWAMLLGAIGTGFVAVSSTAARAPIIGLWLALGVCALLGWWRSDSHVPRIIGLPAFLVWGIIASLHAWINVLRGDLTPTWEPTRRDALGTG
jgi:cellulose synthase/poly-beta-1,6-N-acetylglucosamine synthase-like glycosyltransferase